MKYFIYIVIVIVAAAVVAGFFIVDSPKKARLLKFDEERINNLSFIQSEIINYWMKKGRLPENLDVLTDDLRGVIMPQDPQTGKIYAYGKIRDEKGLTFSLCANFSTNSAFPNNFDTDPQLPPRDLLNWWHGVGYVCFERTIDPELYRPPEPKR